MESATDLYSGLRGMGISAPYASQISHGKRKPGIDLAIRIYDETGAKLGQLKGATKREIAVIKRVMERAT